MMESVTKMIEAKNIGYNLDYLLATIHQSAIPPVIPNHPHLLFGTVAGASSGLLFALLGLCLFQLWRGPTASLTNLLCRGRMILPAHELTLKLGLALTQKGEISLIISQQSLSFLPELVEWLTKRGDRVYILDLASDELPDIMDGEEKSAYLASSRFQRDLSVIKESSNRILILSKELPNSFELNVLLPYADAVVYGIFDEGLSEIESLFFIQERVHQKMVNLAKIGPLLEVLVTKMKNSSSFSPKDVLKRVRSKKN